MNRDGVDRCVWCGEPGTRKEPIIYDAEEKYHEFCLDEQTKEKRDVLNEQIALQFGWTHEGDHHDDPEERGGWRDPQGERGIVAPPDFLLFLAHMFPALETYLAAGESDE